MSESTSTSESRADVASTITETFSIILQRGVEGEPIPKARYIITRAPRSNTFMISTKVRPEDKLDLVPVVIRSLNIVDHANSIVRFQKIMSEIPTQYCGVEDLYGRDTSVVHGTDPRNSMDLHLSGSSAPKQPYPTEEQKAMFDEAVAIIENWARPQGPLEMYGDPASLAIARRPAEGSSMSFMTRSSLASFESLSRQL